MQIQYFKSICLHGSFGLLDRFGHVCDAHKFLSLSHGDFASYNQLEKWSRKINKQTRIEAFWILGNIF